MIIIDNVKYACHSCIKGHRSSQCNHSERTLLPVRRKGRPITQCAQCREQRLKHSVHQKCVCPRDPIALAPSKPIFKKATHTHVKGQRIKKETISTSRQRMAIEALLL
ncbi:copper fist DNA binding domain-domain-containing protein [Syncephalastrum racemosum]|uniref:Copper fist DNA binding domain-domain-containing protein n=1 Tax=Syncephalastrum racemosum TaxID=13706 RepID=A0A1X2HIW9_SYNRA|nr:copper fist DNA binding domain-domain-containing protein [Syncephalastrum racemosum]